MAGIEQMLLEVKTALVGHTDAINKHSELLTKFLAQSAAALGVQNTGVLQVVELPVETPTPETEIVEEDANPSEVTYEEVRAAIVKLPRAEAVALIKSFDCDKMTEFSAEQRIEALKAALKVKAGELTFL